MPVLDRWQFLDKFIELKPVMQKQIQITVYIVSSSIDESDYNRAAAIEQVTAFLIKPVTVNQLKQLVINLN
jgi:YesN/AraC family two-component response regulator